MTEQNVIEIFWYIVKIIIPVVISTGIFGYLFDKRAKKNEFKLQKYAVLIEELSKMATGNNPDRLKLASAMNSCMFFASDGVVREVLLYGKLLGDKKKESNSVTNVIENKDIAPLVKAIRKELDLGSTAIDNVGLNFFK